MSFLVDDMRRVPGGCAPNIAYGLALLGERPLLLATAGHDAAAYRGGAGGGRRGRLRPVALEPDVFTASFFVSTDHDQNQIASFYTGAMARARDLSIAAAGTAAAPSSSCRRTIPPRCSATPTECRRTRHPVPLRPEPAGRAALGRRAARRARAAPRSSSSTTTSSASSSQKTGLSREELEERDAGARGHPRRRRARRSRSPGPAGARATPSRPRGSSARRSTRRASATPSAPASSAGCGSGCHGRWPAAWAASRPSSVSSRRDRSRRAYAVADFRARYERNFGAEPLLEPLARAHGRAMAKTRRPAVQFCSFRRGRSLSSRRAGFRERVLPRRRRGRGASTPAACASGSSARAGIRR